MNYDAAALKTLMEEKELTWDETARLFGVQVRVVRAWASGGMEMSTGASALLHRLMKDSR